MSPAQSQPQRAVHRPTGRVYVIKDERVHDLHGPQWQVEPPHGPKRVEWLRKSEIDLLNSLAVRD